MADRKRLFGLIWAELGKASPLPAKLDPAADGVLEEGEEGDAVAQLHRRLESLGYSVGESDGTFGERTHAAVVAFQAREGLAGSIGEWRMKWTERLAAARHSRTPRKQVTAADLAAKGDKVVTLVLRREGLIGALGRMAAAAVGLDERVANGDGIVAGRHRGDRACSSRHEE